MIAKQNIEVMVDSRTETLKYQFRNIIFWFRNKIFSKHIRALEQDGAKVIIILIKIEVVSIQRRY